MLDANAYNSARITPKDQREFLRDSFAMQYIQVFGQTQTAMGNGTMEELAKEAYGYADAMLDVRGR